MKPKLCILTLVGLAACSLAAVAQTNPPAGDTPVIPASITSTNDAVQPDTAASSPTASEKPAATPAADEAAPAAAPATSGGDSTAAPMLPAEDPSGATTVAANDAAPAAAPADAAAAPAGTVKETAPVQPGGIIPLIVMDDVPLTDAIKNLARQAGLNYMLDPKVTFGQPGPDGRAVAQPTVSIRWENVTAEQALSALLGNYNLQLAEDPKSKIARVTVKDPAAPDPLVTKIIQLKYASPTNITSAVQGAMVDKRSKVVPDVRTSQLVILATEKEFVELEKLIESLDAPTKQVLIEARLVETSVNPSTRKGVNWEQTLDQQNVYFGNTGFGSSIINMSPSGGNFFSPPTTFLTADGVHLVMSFLNRFADARVISSPRTVTLDNEPAHIEVFTASPIINVTPGTVQVSGGSQIVYTNLGIILNVTPRISANNYVNLKVSPEVSRLNPEKLTQSFGAQGIFSASQYDIRKVDTRVMIPSGNTLVLGGMMQDDIRNSNTKVPVLGDIPVVGYLFRVDKKDRLKNNLLVFITPTIVEDSDFQPTKSEFLKTPVPASDSLEEDWSAWDSGKPGITNLKVNDPALAKESKDSGSKPALANDAKNSSTDTALYSEVPDTTTANDAELYSEVRKAQ